ncbi:MAG: type II toxin-antitoxin system PemK/MazF family toxin [Thaumarchaeota archaeon]|nr:type II toxin-antitoxin system PemK/MazF family toxin [Nitrososphaerota archaeon]
MKNPASLQPGDIVKIAQQIIEGQEIKPRPWLVISKNLLHQNTIGCLCLAITTNPTSPYVLKIETKNLLSGSLERINESRVIVDKIVWTRHHDIIGVVAKTIPQFYQQIKNRMKKDVLEID